MCDSICPRSGTADTYAEVLVASLRCPRSVAEGMGLSQQHRDRRAALYPHVRKLDERSLSPNASKNRPATRAMGRSRWPTASVGMGCVCDTVSTPSRSALTLLYT